MFEKFQKSCPIPGVGHHLFSHTIKRQRKKHPGKIMMCARKHTKDIL